MSVMSAGDGPTEVINKYSNIVAFGVNKDTIVRGERFESERLEIGSESEVPDAW